MDLPSSSPTDLPFLVTQWLANYASVSRNQPGGSDTNPVTTGSLTARLPSNNNEEEQQKQKQALETIRKATSEIASAFETLGAFGTTLRPSFGAASILSSESQPQNASYSDLRRRWKNLSPSHLEHLTQAVVATNSAIDAAASETPFHPVNLVQAAGESRDQSAASSNNTTGEPGRTVQEPISIDSDSESPSSSQAVPTSGLSILQAPVLLSIEQTPSSSAGDTKSLKVAASSVEAEKEDSASKSKTKTLAMIPGQSSYAVVGRKTAEVMRDLLETRSTLQSTRQQIAGLHSSLAKQTLALQALNDKYARICQGADMTKMLEVSDEVKAGKQDCERVTAQLKRRLVDLTATLQTKETRLVSLQKQASTWESKRQHTLRGFRDPLGASKGPLAAGHRVGANPILGMLAGRQQGLSLSRNPHIRTQSSILQGSQQPHFTATRRALLATRLSHAATINTHLSYPVYCLRFDRTGRYFVTGADDYLVKLFYLGAGKSCRDKNRFDGSRQLRCNYGANTRGAVLVCSLRGHAGVINDIDVSADNAFLATASVDGDVRIWGLKDGSPIAILRGHKGGANMVSWSMLTPYRLVSTASDGFARVWDIREACLKRYGSHVGKRPEYQQRLTQAEMDRNTAQSSNERSASTSEASLPPLPARDEFTVVRPASESTGEAPLPDAPLPEPAPQNENQIEVPPLPAGVPPLPGADVQNANANNDGAAAAAPPPPGQFVANDELDEGVKLLHKYKHGSSGPELAGPGTRSRRAAINVICVARCPLGGFFATGSDDGICRVYGEEEDAAVGIIDSRESKNKTFTGAIPQARSRLQPSGDPLVRLMGHVSAITDLFYSHAGDRILSGSQKDGVVRIWELGTNLLESSATGGIPQTVIKLTNPSASSSAKQSQASSRRAPRGPSSRSDTSKVSCDVAVWTHDDSRIITSQSVLIKQSGADIQPGSQYLFLWDSRSGLCLMGLSGAHTMQCPVVVPHPTDASLMCTAAADGIAKVWDWESGKCLFRHTNQIEYGPTEASEKNKLAGYLDGAFSPDGTTLVLTDDSGRISIMDSKVSRATVGEENPHSWMREQYFANDYYELYYDTTGYCIERGSERPPHLAPRGVRCNHTGSPWSDEISEAYARLVGPSPLDISTSRWDRDAIRSQANTARRRTTMVSDTRGVKVRVGVREYDPSFTIMLKAEGHVEPKATGASKSANEIIRSPETTRNRSEGSASRNASSQSLSANYRYLDYEDMMREQGAQDDGELDSDDEEFAPAAQRARTSNSDDESDDEMDIDLDAELESPYISSRSRRNQVSTERRQRSQRRAQRLDAQFVEVDSDDENIEQYVSTNKTPSGPYVDDYTKMSHFWCMSSDHKHLKRKWLNRTESNSSYEGRKNYAPQIGDSVVYVARAHYETVSDFPSHEPPWQSWPQGSAWPVVRCNVRGMRYRFPYEDYYKTSHAMCSSIIAILTLEVTGIPEISEDREFPWPKPTFVESTRPFVFEVHLFENEKSEFIFPEGLYVERLRAFESALRQRDAVAGLEVNVFYENNSRTQDAAMQSYQMEVASFVPEDSPANPHLTGSGYGVVQVRTPSDDYAEPLSPWDFSMNNVDIPRPYLSEEDKKLMLENLNALSLDERIAELFNVDVDTVRYWDYERMVEIGMCLMFIKRRVKEDYYAAKVSVVGDVRLIKTNCIKYNGLGSDLVPIVSKMCDDFEDAVLSEEEKAFLITEEEFTKMASSARTQSASRQPSSIRLRLSHRTNHVAAQQHQAQGISNRQRSSLESLPPPEDTEESPNRRRSSRQEALRVSMDHRTGRRSSPRSRPGRVLNNNSGPSMQGRVLRPRARLDSLGRAGARIQRQPRSRGANGGERQLRSSPRNGIEMNPAVPISNSRSTRTRSGGLQAPPEDQEDIDDVLDEEEIAPRASRNTPRRSLGSRRQGSAMAPADDSEAEEEEESYHSDGPSEASEDDASPAPRSRKRDMSPPSRSSPRARRRVETMPEESPTRRSSRRKSENQTSYEEPNSDFEPEDEEPSDESEEEEAPRGRARRATTYTEVPSDFDEESSEDELEEHVPRKASKKRKATTATKKPQGKKTKLDIVDLNEWPDIDLKDITRVCAAIIKEIEIRDNLELFGIPVIEAYPDIADAYLEKVDEPIDLRTIGEERVYQYQNIQALQKDLIQMLQNCVTFNGAGTDYGQYAINIWLELNEMFKTVCEDKNVLIPRRWSP